MDMGVLYAAVNSLDGQPNLRRSTLPPSTGQRQGWRHWQAEQQQQQRRQRRRRACLVASSNCLNSCASSSVSSMVSLMAGISNTARAPRR